MSHLHPYDASYTFLSPPNNQGLIDPSSASSSSSESTTEARLKNFIDQCKTKGKRHGFNLQTDIHEVLAGKGIILLKKDQLCAQLVKCIDAETLLENIRSNAIKKDIKVDSAIYLELATLLPDIDSTTERRSLKMKLNNLHAKASKEMV